MDFPPNSHKSAEKGDTPDKKVEKVVTGEVVQRKKPLGTRFKDVFFGGDFNSAARFVAADVLLPAFRNLVVDAVQEGTRRVMFGESTMHRHRRPEMRSRVQYNNPVNRRDPRERVYLPDQPPHPAPRRGSHEIVLISREDAELVIERLADIVDKYDVASVSDLNDLVGHPSAHTDNKWGWTSLSGVGVRQVREGYLLDLPSPEAI